MKNITLLLGLTALLILNGCTETQEVIPVDDIIGEWTAVEGVTEISYQGMSAYDYAISQGALPDEANYWVGYLTRGHGDYIPFSIEFNEDGTYKSLSGKVGDLTGYENTGVWELSTDRKTLMVDDEEYWPVILDLNVSDLILQFNFDSEEYSQELMNYNITLTYSK